MSEISREQPTLVSVFRIDDGFGSETYRFTPPDYKRSFIDELKEQIPVTHRTWNSEDQYWEVEADYAGLVEELLEHYFNCSVVWEEGEEG